MPQNEYQDLVQRIGKLDTQLRSMDAHIHTLNVHVRGVESTVRTPMWKRFLYGATIAFLAASAGKYWVQRFDTQYTMPCITTIDAQYKEAHGR